MANPFAVAARLQAGDWGASFHGTSHGRLYRDWVVAPLHPDTEIRWHLRELRGRARDLVRNNPYATGIVEAFADNIAGWYGIRMKPRITDANGDVLREINWEIERAWAEWGAPEHASLDHQESWLELQRLIVKTRVTDGEVFVRERRGASNPFAYALQFLDADLLDENYNVPPDERGREIRMGVELNRSGRPVAYHFFKHHPSERGTRDRVRIRADEIIHFFIRYRPGQTRGYTLFAPVLTTLKMIDGLTEAELVASRMGAAKMGFIENKNELAISAYATRLRALNEQGKKQDPQKLEMAPGVIDELLPGQEFTGFSPDHPNGAFEPFLKLMLRGVARGFSMSYLTATGDVSAANYSSMRAGLLPERDHWRILQQIQATRVHRRVYRDWIAMALLTDALRLPSPVASDYHDVEWRGRGWKWVDPLDDLIAAERGIALGTTSRQRIAAEHGDDYEVIVDELAEEQEYAAEQGVWVDGVMLTGKKESSGRARDGEDPGRASRRSALLAPAGGVNRIASELNGDHG